MPRNIGRGHNNIAGSGKAAKYLGQEFNPPITPNRSEIEVVVILVQSLW